MSTGYSDRPVARAIKIKHAGLNLTGPGISVRLCVPFTGTVAMTGPVCVAGLGPPFGMRPVPAQAD